jgi:hypothetical protein
MNHRGRLGKEPLVRDFADHDRVTRIEEKKALTNLVSDWRYPPPSRPRAVEGGQGTRGRSARPGGQAGPSVPEDIGMGNQL